MTHRWPGIPLALLSAALFGASTPLAKMLLGQIDPWLMAGLLYLGAGIGLGGVLMARHAFGLPTVEASLRRRNLPWLAAIIVTGGIAGPALLMLGLARTNAGTAALLLNLEGAATLALAWIIFRENVDAKLLLGALAILAGAAILSWSGSGLTFHLGALMVVAACVAWGIDNNLTRKLSSADPVQIAMLKGLMAGSINVILAAGQGAVFPDGAMLLTAAVVGFFGYGLSLVLFVLALRHLGTARTGAYFALAPFIGAALAVAVLGEPLSTQLVAAAALMGLGLCLHLAERHEHPHSHEEAAHEHRHVHDGHHLHEHNPNNSAGEPHSHPHRHGRLRHSHAHYPDLHHRHPHS